MKKNNIGRNSLIISILGLIILQSLIYFGYLNGKNWSILLYGFEAATIGGFADWFAVKALFREIPIPFVRKHTNIIIKNRNKLSDGIVDLVTNKWLSIKIIKEKINKIEISSIIIKTLSAPTEKEKLEVFVKKAIHFVISKIDNPSFSKGIKKLIIRQIENIDFPIILGKLIENSIKNGYQNDIIALLLKNSSKILEDKSTRDILLEKVEKTITSYKREAVSKGIMIKVATKLGAIDNKVIADKILISLHEFIDDIKNNENHVVREKINYKALKIVDELKDQESNATKAIKSLQIKLKNYDGLNSSIEKLLFNLKVSTLNQLDNDTSQINVLLKKQIDNFLSELKTNTTLQKSINTSVRDILNKLIEKYHVELGNMVSLSLANLKDDELVNQIEEKVGNDLQYIRLNGAIVGGIVGLIIAFIRVKILYI